MKRISTLVLTVLLATVCAVAFGQDNNKNSKDWRDRMKAEKIAFLTDAMDLTSAEAETFWPVYNRAEAERKAAWNAVADAFRALEEAIQSGKDEKELSVLLEKYVNAQKEDEEVDVKYLHEYRKILSNSKIAKLYIGEEKFRRMQIHKLNKNDKK